MDAACKGAKSAGGTTIGVLPGNDSSELSGERYCLVVSPFHPTHQRSGRHAGRQPLLLCTLPSWHDTELLPP